MFISVRYKKLPFMLSPQNLSPIVKKETKGEIFTLLELAAFLKIPLKFEEAEKLIPYIEEHKWLMSESLSRDVGFKVAACDYLKNIYKKEIISNHL